MQTNPPKSRRIWPCWMTSYDLWHWVSPCFLTLQFACQIWKKEFHYNEIALRCRPLISGTLPFSGSVTLRVQAWYKNTFIVTWNKKDAKWIQTQQRRIKQVVVAIRGGYMWIGICLKLIHKSRDFDLSQPFECSAKTHLMTTFSSVIWHYGMWTGDQSFLTFY